LISAGSLVRVQSGPPTLEGSTWDDDFLEAKHLGLKLLECGESSVFFDNYT